MTDVNFYQVVDRYFASFCQKNLKKLSGLVTEDVFLQDWETKAVGLDEFLTFNSSVFSRFSEIKIERISTDIFSMKAFCLIRISFDNHAPVELMDVITLSHDGKINSINAYRQF